MQFSEHLQPVNIILGAEVSTVKQTEYIAFPIRLFFFFLCVEERKQTVNEWVEYLLTAKSSIEKKCSRGGI